MDTSVGYQQAAGKQERPLLHSGHDTRSRRAQVCIYDGGVANSLELNYVHVRVDAEW